MDMSTLYLLLFLAVVLFTISLVCAVTERTNIITVACMFVSGLVCWVISNAYVGGTLTRINEVTGAADVIRDGIASDIFMLFGLLAMAGAVIQIWYALSSSGVVEELGE